MRVITLTLDRHGKLRKTNQAILALKIINLPTVLGLTALLNTCIKSRGILKKSIALQT
jgi:hypothetical protein